MIKKKNLFKRPPFIQRGYYVPLVLSNGVDFCQVDITGSCAFKDHIKGYGSFWYKKGRPNQSDPIALTRPYYAFKSDRGRVEAGDFSQNFDPLTGRLHTKISMYQLEMLIETFLTDDHTLIEKYKILKSTGKKGELLFFLLFYNHSYTGKPYSIIPQSEKNLTCFLKDGIPAFLYQYGEKEDLFRGQGMMGIRKIVGNPWIVPFQEGKYLLRITVDRLRKGNDFARIITLVDDRDAADWKRECERIHAFYMTARWRDVESNNIRAWKQFSERSSFTCDEPDITDQFDTSLYVCKASLHPNGSSVSALAHPNSHGMGTYWDIWYVHSALLRTNRLEEAGKIINFWQKVFPDGKRFAKNYYKVRGARFEWTYKYNGTPHGHSEQVHSNILPGLMVWEHYLYTQDRELLKQNYRIILESVLFLIDYAMRKDSRGKYFLRELISSDESDTKKRNELLTAIGIKKGIQIARLAAGVLGEKVPDDILDAEKPIEKILNSLKKNGIFLLDENADTGTWATIWAYIHFPDSKVFPKALDYALEGCREPYGLGIGMTSRMRCATFPWVEGIFAWAMARNGDRRAYEYLRMTNRYTNFYGGMPEYVWLHGEPSRDWFVAAHGVFLTVLCELIVVMKGDTLEVLPLGVESLPWKSVKVERFRVENGILVSFEFNRDSIELILHNDASGEKSFVIEGPNFFERVALKSRKRINRSWSIKTSNKFHKGGA